MVGLHIVGKKLCADFIKQDKDPDEKHIPNSLQKDMKYEFLLTRTEDGHGKYLALNLHQFL